ncbi:MAG: hypothetical protein GY937_20070 [bacterium]|nr:hypothetical protein [bacterium]
MKWACESLLNGLFMEQAQYIAANVKKAIFDCQEALSYLVDCKKCMDTGRLSDDVFCECEKGMEALTSMEREVKGE